MVDVQFTPYFQKLKEEIKGIYLEINSTKGTNRKITILFYQFLIHRQLTQKQLRSLTRFSLGYISETLKYLTEFGVLSRSIIKGSNQYEYSLKSSFLGMGKVLFVEIMKDIHVLQSKMYQKLSHFLNPDLYSYSEASSIIACVKRMIIFLDKYEQSLFQIGQAMYGGKGVKSPPQKPLQLATLSSYAKRSYQRDKNPFFDSQFSDLLLIFAESRIIPYHQTAKKKLFGAMIFLNDFTEVELKNLVKLSYKTYSEHFKFFNEDRQILDKDAQDIDIPGKKTVVIYRLKAIEQIISRNFRNTSKEIVSKMARLTEIKRTLELKKSELSPEKGYQEIIEFLNDFFEITANIGKMVQKRK